MRHARVLLPSVALFLTAVIAGMPHSARSATDVISSWGGKWHVSFNGTGPWQDLNGSNIGVSDLRFGDFDGNCRTDVFAAWGGKWRVSFNGTGPWQIIGGSNVAVSDLRFGDFDGDGKTDVFAAWGGKWRVSFGGTGPWQIINTSNIGVSGLGFGNFDGNNAGTDTMARACLRISRFTTSALTNAEADTILTSMSNVLQTDDGAGDVACLMQFTRSGAVAAFATGDGSIDSEAEINAVDGLPGHVKVVNQINWCDALMPNVIGCAPISGGSYVVVRFAASQEGILWLHEYGHNRGLKHRNAANAVMNATMGINRTGVNASECTAFRR